MQTVDTPITVTVAGEATAHVWISMPLPTPVALIFDIPINVCENSLTGGYGGTFWWDDSPRIELSVPGDWASADKLVVLSILLHEYAHAKQHATLGSDKMVGFCEHYKQSAPNIKPLEKAANKYALNIVARLGIPPSAVGKKMKEVGLWKSVGAGWTR